MEYNQEVSYFFLHIFIRIKNEKMTIQYDSLKYENQFNWLEIYLLVFYGISSNEPELKIYYMRKQKLIK